MKKQELTDVKGKTADRDEVTLYRMLGRRGEKKQELTDVKPKTANGGEVTLYSLLTRREKTRTN